MSDALDLQISLLLKLIYESENCSVAHHPDEKRIIFKTKNNGSVTRGQGSHCASMPIVPFALGNKYVVGNNSMSVGIEVPDEFEVHYDGKDYLTNDIKGHKSFESPEQVRDALLNKEFTTLLVSAQNNDYFVNNNAEFHPRTGLGATNSRYVCSNGLLDDFDIDTTVTDSTIVINVTGDVSKLEMIVRQISDTLGLSPGEIEISESKIILNKPVIEVLESMHQKRVNYQGSIPFDQDGKILIAQRKNAFEDFTLGFSTAGGHCSDPYHPEVGMLKELGLEYGMEVKSIADLHKMKIVSKEKDVALFTIPHGSYKLTQEAEEYVKKHKEKNPESAIVFQGDPQEFIPGTECTLSLKEIREEKLPLRNIPSIELYLKDCQERIAHLLNDNTQNMCVVEIPSNSVVTLSGKVKVPDSDFGIIKISSQNIVELKQDLEQRLGIDLQYSVDQSSIIIDQLNPEQIISALEANKENNVSQLKQFIIKEDNKVKQGDAAKIIQRAWKRILSYKEVKDATSKSLGEENAINIKSRSDVNMAAIEERLKKATGLTEDQKKSLMEEKGGDDNKVISAREFELLKCFLNREFWLNHTTHMSVLEAVVDGRGSQMQDSVERARREGKKPEILREVYVWGGATRNVFWGIGHKSSSTVNIDDDSAIVRISLSSLFEKDPKSIAGIWSSDHFYDYKEQSDKSSVIEYKFGTTTYSVEYKKLEEDGVVKYVKNHKYKKDDGSELIQTINIGDEIAVGKDILYFMGIHSSRNYAL